MLHFRLVGLEGVRNRSPVADIKTTWARCIGVTCRRRPLKRTVGGTRGGSPLLAMGARARAVPPRFASAISRAFCPGIACRWV